jgi:hypothetical protein
MYVFWTESPFIDNLYKYSKSLDVIIWIFINKTSFFHWPCSQGFNTRIPFIKFVMPILPYRRIISFRSTQFIGVVIKKFNIQR